MFSTHTPAGLQRSPAEHDPHGRLNWLLAANAQEAQRRRLFRTALEEEQMLMMRHPVSTEGAYALLGMLLGALPPAVIFIRMFGYGLDHQYGLLPFPFVLCLAMNIVCCLVGRAAGASLGKHTSGLTDAGWHKSALIYSCLGAAWGAVTGAAGGFIAFGLGALFGAVCAIPVGVAAFLLFAPLHRLLRCGDMIDARQLWPLACGVTMTIAALILGL